MILIRSRGYEVGGSCESRGACCDGFLGENRGAMVDSAMQHMTLMRILRKVKDAARTQEAEEPKHHHVQLFMP